MARQSRSPGCNRRSHRCWIQSSCAGDLLSMLSMQMEAPFRLRGESWGRRDCCGEANGRKGRSGIVPTKGQNVKAEPCECSFPRRQAVLFPRSAGAGAVSRLKHYLVVTTRPRTTWGTQLGPSADRAGAAQGEHGDLQECCPVVPRSPRGSLHCGPGGYSHLRSSYFTKSQLLVFQHHRHLCTHGQRYAS